MAHDTKTALLDAAEKAARRRGFDGFSYSDLAEEVGIRKASIHYHFPTKSDLSLALILRYTDSFFADLEEVKSARSTGAGRIDALIDIYREALFGGETVCLCVSFSAHADPLPEAVLSDIRSFRKGLIAWIADALRLAQDDGTLRMSDMSDRDAPGVLALLEGAQLAARAQGDLGPYDDAVTLLRSRFGKQ